MSQASVPPVRHRMLAGLCAVQTAVGEAAQADCWSLSDQDIGRALEEIAAVKARLAAVELAVVAEADGRRLGTVEGASGTAGWLRGRLRLHPGEAARTVRLAGALHAGCVATGAALAAGVISAEQARVICQVIAGLPPVEADVRDRAETFLIGQAAVLDPVALSRAGRVLTETLTSTPDVDADDRVIRQMARRELSLIPAYDGMTLLRGQLDPEAAALLSAALHSLAAPRPAGPDGSRDPRSAGRRYADALVDLTALAVAAGTLPSSGGAKPTLNVTIDLDVLSGRRPGAGRLDTGEPLSAGAARRLACDARIVPLVLDGNSQPLDIGRATPTVPAGMRRALVARDQACSFPGCDRPAQWCEAHHVVHWTTGHGPTALDNLTLVCGAHHDAVHHHGWTVVIDGDGLPTYRPPPWIDPTGQPRRNQRYQQRKLTHHLTGHDPPSRQRS